MSDDEQKAIAEENPESSNPINQEADEEKNKPTEEELPLPCKDDIKTGIDDEASQEPRTLTKETLESMPDFPATSLERLKTDLEAHKESGDTKEENLEIIKLQNENKELKNEVSLLNTKLLNLQHEFEIMKQDIMLLKIKTSQKIKKESSCEWVIINGIKPIDKYTIKYLPSKNKSSFIGEYRTTFLKHSFSKGIVQFGIEIMHINGYGGMYFGIVPKENINLKKDVNQTKDKIFIGSKNYLNSIGYCGQDGRIYLNGVMLPGFWGSTLQKGNKVLVSIDLDKLILSFFIDGKKQSNDISLKHKDKNTQPKSYCFGVSLYNENDQVRLFLNTMDIANDSAKK